MKIGVIIPARNTLPYLEEMLDSVQGQTHAAHAYIAEDRSDDGTYEWLREHPDLWAGMRRNRKRLGWAGSLNAAARLALHDGCDALFTASADDRLHPECIARCMAALNADGGRDFVVPHAQQFGEADHVQASLPDATLADFAQWPPLIDKALIRRRVWETVGGYSAAATPPGTYGTAEDWDWWIRVWKAGFTRYSVVEQPLYFVRVHPGQLSDARAEHHAATVDLLRKLHPSLPWTEASGQWPPQHRTTRRTT
ncbi:glycosyltransferase family 2 protein [Streptomyces stelliscabiei]|uniref:glycosyltransferase family 2 protein n=1 Tax=Streptomyces stelliscabiei TaxID=146820 RepID=UPI0029BA05DF|nr:glycosyltransferase family A protein [Streptomyces stelliscabiei]MDX2550106.1 glycosyltransferase family A protein [Streptomyces stelliscabiei]